MFRVSKFMLSGLALALACTAASAAPVYSNFPVTAKYGVVGGGLPDGRLIIYNGDAVFLQTAPNVDSFTSVATGYEGDPSFLAVSPDGTEALMGAGGFGDLYTGDIYRFNVTAPANFAPSAVALNRNHYSAVYLSPTLLLIDAGVFPNSELAIVDVTAKSGGQAPVTVVNKPVAKANVVDPKPGFSAHVAYDGATDTVYAMDSNARELRAFSGAALIDAYNNTLLLDWTTDSALVGQAGDYYSGGVAGITTDGNLIIDGSEGFGLPGGVQLVNPNTGAILNTTDPAGDEGFTTVIVNVANEEVVVQQSGQNFTLSFDDLDPAPVGPTPGLPVGGSAVVITTIALGALMARRR
ncbi:MAG: hypothetical protein GC168_06360 [Candidatus Hydrogenedens sp.]|nr:hypothetical protein [Candidatus Hydrogenedens sp.]